MPIEVVDDTDEYARGYVEAVQDCIGMAVERLKLWGASASMEHFLDDLREILVPLE